MPKTTNEKFFEALLAHQVGLLQVSATIRDKIVKELIATESEIRDKIRSRLLNHGSFRNSRDVLRLKTLRRLISKVRTVAWENVEEIWLTEIRKIAENEPKFASMILRTVSPVILSINLPPNSVIDRIINTLPFEGKTLKQWAQHQKQVDLDNIMSQIHIGMVQGESSAQIARRVVVSSRSAANSVTKTSRRQAAAVTRTAINHIGNAVRREFYLENENLFSWELYVATLDSRTTPICRSLDGNRYEIGKGPIPPLHWLCRSLRIAILDDQVLGERPANPTTEKMLVGEFKAQNGITKPGSLRRHLPHGTKGQFDKFARTRKRQLIGRTPSQVTYSEWLKGQSASFQDDVLGPTRGRLFRSGQLTLDKFIDRAGKPLTLEELADRHAREFKAAGLDPANF